MSSSDFSTSDHLDWLNSIDLVLLPVSELRTESQDLRRDPYARYVFIPSLDSVLVRNVSKELACLSWC